MEKIIIKKISNVWNNSSVNKNQKTSSGICIPVEVFWFLFREEFLILVEKFLLVITS